MHKPLLLSAVIFLSCLKAFPAQTPTWKKPADLAGDALVHGRLPEAEKYFQLALAEMERGKIGGEALADCLDNLGLVYALRRKFAEAQKMYLRAMDVNRGTKDADYRIAFNLWHLGQLYRYAGKNTDSLTALEQAVGMTEKSKGPEHLQIANILVTMAEVSVNESKYNEAETSYKRAIAIYEKSLGANHWTVADALKDYGKVLERLGRKSEANEVTNRAKKIEAIGKPREPYKVQP